MQVRTRISEGAELLQLFSELPRRGRAFQYQILRGVAAGVLEAVVARVPRGDRYRWYRDGLVLGEVREARDGRAAWAVYLSKDAKHLSKHDADSTLIYVIPKRRKNELQPAVAVLATYNPWTISTLPVTPSPRDARIEYRRTSKSRVKRVGAQRRRDRPKWRQQLMDAGIRKISEPKAAVPQDLRDVPDVVLQAMDLEFGLGGHAAPHWRPALLGVTRGTAIRDLLRRDRKLLRSLTDVRFKGWMKWPEHAPKKLSPQDAAAFGGLWERLGIRVPR